MSADADRYDIYAAPFMGSGPLQVLSGASPGQIRSWRAIDLLSPCRSSESSRRLFYSWIDYSRARMAVKLTQQGVTRRRLRAMIERLDEAAPRWEFLLLGKLRGRAVINSEDRKGFAIRECDNSEFGSPETLRVDVPSHCSGDADLTQALAVLEELRREGSLGRLANISDLLMIDPEMMWGQPSLVGHRLQTSVVALPVLAGQVDVAEQAERYQITVEQVEAAVAFEDVLAA